MTSIDAIAGLPSDIRRRLEAFTSRVERIGLDQLPIYAARPLGSDHRRAIEQADLVANAHGRLAAVAAVRAMAFGYIERQFVNAPLHASGLGLMDIGSGRVEDRARVAVSLGEAITGIALWDLLDEGVRDEMLGAWAGLAG